MQKVKCINDDWQAAPGLEEAPRPVFNQDYTIVETKMCDGVLSHILVEFGDEYGYKASHFAVLPDATADEMAEEEQFIYDQLSC